jgi:hypothetical protein
MKKEARKDIYISGGNIFGGWRSGRFLFLSLPCFFRGRLRRKDDGTWRRGGE